MKKTFVHTLKELIWLICPQQKYLSRETVPLKGPKQEIFENGFFTQIRRLRLGDLGTGEKIEFSKVGVIILRFSPRISY